MKIAFEVHIAGVCPNGHRHCLSAECWAVRETWTLPMALSPEEIAGALRHAAKVVQDHVTRSESAQVALTVNKTYRDTLFRLRDDLERMAHQIESEIEGEKDGPTDES